MFPTQKSHQQILLNGLLSSLALMVFRTLQKKCQEFVLHVTYLYRKPTLKTCDNNDVFTLVLIENSPEGTVTEILNGNPGIYYIRYRLSGYHFPSISTDC